VSHRIEAQHVVVSQPKQKSLQPRLSGVEGLVARSGVGVLVKEPPQTETTLFTPGTSFFNCFSTPI
jgi:hypothetical protein